MLTKKKSRQNRHKGKHSCLISLLCIVFVHSPDYTPWLREAQRQSTVLFSSNHVVVGLLLFFVFFVVVVVVVLYVCGGGGEGGVIFICDLSVCFSLQISIPICRGEL